jgi:hypothetical protein
MSLEDINSLATGKDIRKLLFEGEILNQRECSDERGNFLIPYHFMNKIQNRPDVSEYLTGNNF